MIANLHSSIFFIPMIDACHHCDGQNRLNIAILSATLQLNMIHIYGKKTF